MSKILILSRNFPNNIQKTRGLFVSTQVNGIKNLDPQKYSMYVISPIAYLPIVVSKVYTSETLKISNRIVKNEINIIFPRWFVLPRNLFKIIYPLFLWLSVRKAINQNWINFDLVHAHFCYPDGVVGYYLAKKQKKPLVITAHTGSLHLLIKKFYWKYFLKDAFTYASKIVAVSPRIKNDLIEFGVNEKKIVTIPNIISQHFIEQKRTKISTKKIKIISIGNLVWLKGFDYLIRAISILRKQGYDIDLTIVGNGRLLPVLKQLTVELGIEKAVTFSGNILNTDLPKLYNEHDIFVSSSLIESFGVVAFEAIAVGLPVVVTKSGGAEQFIDKRFGEIVDKADEAQLAEGIKSVIDNIDTYDKSLFKKFITENFSEYEISNKIRDLYDELT